MISLLKVGAVLTCSFLGASLFAFSFLTPFTAGTGEGCAETEGAHL
jgi:hypothetical protein